MAEINVAYGILSDPEKRKVYDLSRNATHSNFDDSEDEKDAAFDSALDQQDESWELVLSIFPDLETIRKRLYKIERGLAYAFVTTILDCKKFNTRHEIANAMESAFLERHFGSDPKIIAFAQKLIVLGAKDAMYKLNQYVEVLGSGIDVEKVIVKITLDFEIKDTPFTWSTTSVWDKHRY
jgi:hypothetical protein